MTVSVSNTNLVDSFNTWRLNTNLLATIVSNNVVTVARAGDANRGGVATGNGHIIGTFSANQLRTSELRGGNTTSGTGGSLTIPSNTTISSAALTVSANTTFSGNVDFNTVGTDRVNLGNISRVILSGGTNGQFPKVVDSDHLDFVTLNFRSMNDLTTNTHPIVLSAANTTASDNGDSPKLMFQSRDRSDGNTVALFASNNSAHSTSLVLQLADDNANSQFVITNNSNTVLHYVDSHGRFVHTGNSIFNGTATFNGVSNFNGTMNINGNVNVGDAASDVMNVTSRSDLFGATNIGNANTDTLSVLAEVDTNIIPAADATYSLGQNDKEWLGVYANNVTTNSVTLPDGDVQTQINNAGGDALAFAIALG